MKLFTLATAIGLGLAFSVGAQQTNTDEQQQPPTSKEKRAEQTADQPAGPPMGHSSREKVKDTSQQTRVKAGATTTAKTNEGAVSHSTTVFRNGQQTSESLTFHRSTRDRADVHFSIGTHPRDWWLRTYSIVLIDGCHYYQADNGCWYPAYGFDPSCNFQPGVVYCD